MRTHRGALAGVAALAVMGAGCVGYEPSAKRWAYVGNTVLVVGGGAAITSEVVAGDDVPSSPGDYRPPMSGVFVAGALLVVAGLVGVLVTATRTPLKTSR